MSSPNDSRSAIAADSPAPAAAKPGAPDGLGRDVVGQDAVAQLDELYQQQLRGAAAEIAAAVAHAVGTPLNVISGRAELIRQDPGNALPQVTRIEEQVRKLADGLRDFVEYLTSDARVNADMPSAEVVARACNLLRPVTEQYQVQLVVDASAIQGAGIQPPGAPVDQRSLSNLVTLLSWGVRCTAAAAQEPAQRKLQLTVSPANGGISFELVVPGLALPEHWRIERFEANPPSSESEAFRMVAICAAIARGQGGKLQADALPSEASATGGGVRVRLLCRSSVV